MRQCSLISACIMHSAEQARAIRIVDCIIDDMTCMSQPCMRSIIRIMVSVMSAQLAHSAAHLPIPSPASASAHMMHACMHAERASMVPCITAGSMPFIGMPDDDMAPFIMSIVMFMCTTPPSWAAERRRCRRGTRQPCSGPCYAGGPGRTGGCRRLLAIDEDEHRDHDRDEELHRDLHVVQLEQVAHLDGGHEEHSGHELRERAVHHRGQHDAASGRDRLDLHEEPAEEGG